MPKPLHIQTKLHFACKGAFLKEESEYNREKGMLQKEKAAFVPYELFIQSSNELSISHSNNLSGNSK